MRTAIAIFFVSLFALSATGKEQPCSESYLNTCFISALKEINTVKPGMTRENLLKLFTPSGGFYTVTPSKGVYVYKRSSYIKIDVEFSPASGEFTGTEQNAKDVITVVSRPYLASPQYD